MMKIEEENIESSVIETTDDTEKQTGIFLVSVSIELMSVAYDSVEEAEEAKEKFMKKLKTLINE